MGGCFVYKMTVETFILTWNREDAIHLTINHYKKLGKVTIYDNFSDDRTREIAESLGADVRLYGRAGVLDDQVYVDIKNHCWKQSKADWVIVVDDDEILYHPLLTEILEQAVRNETTIFHTQGFSIHSNSMPATDWLEIQTGVRDENYSKTVIFNPKALNDINYIYGCHQHRAKGRLVYGEDKLLLLHYRSVGGVERLLKRHREYEPRRQKSSVNMRWNLGGHYADSEEQKRREWKESLEKSEILQRAGLL